MGMLAADRVAGHLAVCMAAPQLTAPLTTPAGRRAGWVSLLLLLLLLLLPLQPQLRRQAQLPPLQQLLWRTAAAV